MKDRTKAYAKRRDRGLRKKYNGRKESNRFDSKSPALTEIHPKPIRIYSETARDSPDDGEYAQSFALKHSRDKDRRNLQRDDVIQMVDNDKNTYLLRVIRVVVSRKSGKSGTEHRLVCTITDAHHKRVTYS